jgi:4-amino-4-deoxy-L-arabinose transferase-like glycosyltransferase
MNIGHLRFLVLLAAISFLPTLAFYYVGEEAIFPITSLEMWHRGEWTRQHLYGLNLQHNPLFNWLIIPAAALAGWEHVLPITRAITVTATLATGAVTGWLAWRLLRDATLAWFAALIYLTLADVLLYRGWLAYVDPLFGFFVFAAIAALWVACEERRPALIALAVASLTCAFMSKAFTAYVFYGGAALVLMMEPRRRRVLLGAPSLVLHAAAALAPVLWLSLLPGTSGQGTRMFGEILAKLAPKGAVEYLQQLAGFPAETVLRLSPAILLVAYFSWRRRIAVSAEFAPHLRTALWIALLGYLPYWLSPHGAIRYLVPIYPLIAFVLALLLWSAGEQARLSTRRWLIGMIALKFVAAVFLFPYYQSHYRGENYALAARDIIERSSGHPLYTTSDTASGLSVAGYIDARWRQGDPIKWPPEGWSTGVVFAEEADPAVGEVSARFKLGGDELFLLCRGAACGSGAR